MEWQENTVHSLEKLFNNKDFKEWSGAIGDGEINKFSEELIELNDRLSRIIIAELEIPISEREKVIKILDLAALAGKIL